MAFIVPEAARLVHPGERFGKWTVTGVPFRLGCRQTVVCQCDCGELRIVDYFNMRKGLSSSCGCLQRSSRNPPEVRRLRDIWGSMMQRCFNPQHRCYRHYGGRGITVCKEWATSRDAFVAWSIANGHRNDLTIDRIENDGNYEPGNCRWATTAEQSRNKRTNCMITVEGETLCASDWADKIGIGPQAMRARVVKYGKASTALVSDPQWQNSRRYRKK